ncbi:HAD family hydrolase [Nocardia carnea]|uniref:HAD family hydrolase n=1 Tax=Nocardia carnea TaxID=37328 RepID=UPI0024546CDD|nr:HAD-IA family hydrolase [Nocardia carnea]
MTESPPDNEITAVIFDFSGTLFRLEHSGDWVDQLGFRTTDLDIVELMRWMTAPTDPPIALDADHLHAWRHRDLDPTLHRAAYAEILAHWGTISGVDVQAMYDILVDPLKWTPYPDTPTVLEKLSSAGITVTVLSNIAFDIRPAFISRGWDKWIDHFVLSYEVGAAKPDPSIFLAAVERMGARAEHTLMIGDSPESDGGAAQIGCPVALVEPTPTTTRQDGLLAALRTHNLPV